MPFSKTSKQIVTKREILSSTVYKISICVTDKNGYTNGRPIRALAPSGNFICQQPTSQLYKKTHWNHKASQVAWQVWLTEELESVLRHVQWKMNTSTLDQKSIQNTIAGIACLQGLNFVIQQDKPYFLHDKPCLLYNYK